MPEVTTAQVDTHTQQRHGRRAVASVRVAFVAANSKRWPKMIFYLRKRIDSIAEVVSADTLAFHDSATFTQEPEAASIYM